ncbi:unnamed protein product [Caenorhabditis angaria]|uniref:Uncharacterized protein n=1 Tax=Caenorhabditis angaria TaxID=860376 RepID=A0A9P1ICK0_9PELO|nr:unnamed protein product [Caenorhabditis angaria]
MHTMCSCVNIQITEIIWTIEKQKMNSDMRSSLRSTLQIKKMGDQYMNIADAGGGAAAPPPPPPQKQFPAFPNAGAAGATGAPPLPPPPPPIAPGGGALRENDDIELESDMKKPVPPSGSKSKGGKTEKGKDKKKKKKGGKASSEDSNRPPKAIIPRIVLFVFFVLYLAAVGGWLFVLLCGLGSIGTLDDAFLSMGS